MELMDGSIKTELNKYIDNIASVDGVEKIYLFGSYAYGIPNKDSDIDLMVIIEDNLNTIKTAFKINMKIVGKKYIPSDILVNRKSDFERESMYTTIQNKIKKEGIIIYDKQ